MQPFTLLIKPAGSDCNLDCTYCFYKNRAPEIGSGKQRMTDIVLEKLIKDYMQLGLPEAGFAWQGGEPTLMGLDFYEKAVELQKKYACPNQKINNSLQTNAILLDEKWCRFLHENNFLVGISIDGPQQFHDDYRTDNAGAGSFDKVMKALKICKDYKVEFNVLVLLNDKNVECPDELFDFFIENKIKYLQFVPCIEKVCDTNRIADFSITPQQYGRFLCRIFDRWRELGMETLSIRTFDSILSHCLTDRHTICVFDKRCAGYIVVEYTGDVFPCDFFVEPKWRLGNIMDTPINELAAGAKKLEFNRAKQNLSNNCLVCRYLDVCRGGCQKDRIDSKPYFCQSYKDFFDYASPKFMQIAADINQYT